MERGSALKGHFLGRGSGWQIFTRGLLRAIELEDRVDTNFPNAPLGVALLFVLIFPAAKLALDLQMRALGQGLCVVGELSPNGTIFIKLLAELISDDLQTSSEPLQTRTRLPVRDRGRER